MEFSDGLIEPYTQPARKTRGHLATLADTSTKPESRNANRGGRAYKSRWPTSGQSNLCLPYLYVDVNPFHLCQVQTHKFPTCASQIEANKPMMTSSKNRLILSKRLLTEGLAVNQALNPKVATG